MAAIELKDIAKRYLLEYRQRRSLKELFLNLSKRQPRQRELWALKEINLDIPKGQVLGVIGENGSGKTTLLKVISKVTNSTKGSLKINGRVAAILELNMGFQEDLTGRENIYLNGSILGLSRKELQKNLDSIIDFSDIGDFIDAPLRTYSSGMQLRLGFAIATHIDFDILLIDEVLSVGDLGFQEKCFKKINEYKQKDKALLLVTQNMSIIKQLCNHVIWLRQGRVIKEGEPIPLAKEYEVSMQRSIKKEQKLLNLETEITNVYFLDAQKVPNSEFAAGEEMTIRIEYYAHKKVNNPVFGLAIFKDNGMHITGPNTKFSDFNIDYIEGNGKVDFVITALPLLPGDYDVSVAIHTFEDEFSQYDSLDRMFRFTVTPGEKKEKYGLISITHKWIE